MFYGWKVFVVFFSHAQFNLTEKNINAPEKPEQEAELQRDAEQSIDDLLRALPRS